MLTRVKISIIITISVLFLSTISFPSLSFSADYDQAFIEVFGTSSIIANNVSARSPLRNNNGTDSWAQVNSKTNQPRTSGTNPHQGADLKASAGTSVYPITKSKVAAINPIISSQLGSVTLNLDINNDGIYDNVYVKYLHIVPSNSLFVGRELDETFPLGIIDSFKAYPPHLHIQRVESTSASAKTLKLYNFYRYTPQWNNGSHLDFLSGDYHFNNGFYITA